MAQKQDPFFSYLAKERRSVLQDIYGVSTSEKSYERFPRTPLPDVLAPPDRLAELLNTRRSERDFEEGQALTLLQVSSLLKYGTGFQDAESSGEKRRVHPSGGAKYPLELYLAVRKVSGIKGGLHHYHPSSQSLEFLPVVNAKNVRSKIASLEPFTEKAAALVLFSFVKSRSMGKYGGLAYKLALLEAGHISQNIYLLSAAHGIGCCGLGLANAPEINPLLSLDGINESIIYGMALGCVSG